MRRIRKGNGADDPSPGRYAAILAVPYFLIAVVYILLTSGMLETAAADTAEFARIEKIKGSAFVFLSALFIFVLARVLFARLLAQKREIDKQTRALLQSENRAVAGIFAASIAHDMNNIMMGLYNDVMEYATLPDLSAEEKERASRLRFAAEEMIALARNLSQSATGEGIPGSPVRVPLASCLEETVAFARHHRTVRRCQLEVSIDSGGTVEGIPVILRQVLLNLLLNAAEATGGTGKVRVSCREAGGEILLEVHDNGPGIPEDQREAIFEAFHSGKQTGTGLGLHSVRAGVELHDGSVEVDRSLLGGALFRIHLPLAKG